MKLGQFNPVEGDVFCETATDKECLVTKSGYAYVNFILTNGDTKVVSPDSENYLRSDIRCFLREATNSSLTFMRLLRSCDGFFIAARGLGDKLAHACVMAALDGKSMIVLHKRAKQSIELWFAAAAFLSECACVVSVTDHTIIVLLKR